MSPAPAPAPPPSDDATTVTRSRTDPEAFGEVFDRHAGAVHAFLSRRAGRQTADDLLGEVFAVAFERRRRYDTSYADARPWLYGIAHHLLRNHLRGTSRRLALVRRTPIDPPGEPWDDIDARLDADAPGTAARRALDSLPEGERVVVQLVAWEDLSVAEAARSLGIPAGTARSRLHRARTALRAALEESPGPARSALLPNLIPQED